jgi:ferric-dicitrate binding protein FerR (iron transport regulator)
MDKELLLHKYLNGTATEEEIAVLRSDPEYADYLDIAQTSATFEAPPFEYDSLLQAITAQLGVRQKTPKKRYVQILWRIAAVLVVVLAGYYFFALRDTSVGTQIAQIETITLPDATEVMLNATSQLRYNTSNWKKERQVRLKGEAFFKVAKGSTFRVNTNLGEVTVLGTQFNVYARDSIFEVHCFEGLVQVAVGDRTTKLEAGEGLRFTKGEALLTKEHRQAQPDWLQAESSFEYATLREVLSELERQYPVRITVSDSMRSKHFTGSFTHTNLEKALRSICEPLQLEFTIAQDEVTIYAK